MQVLYHVRSLYKTYLRVPSINSSNTYLKLSIIIYTFCHASCLSLKSTYMYNIYIFPPFPVQLHHVLKSVPQPVYYKSPVLHFIYIFIYVSNHQNSSKPSRFAEAWPWNILVIRPTTHYLTKPYHGYTVYLCTHHIYYHFFSWVICVSTLITLLPHGYIFIYIYTWPTQAETGGHYPKTTSTSAVLNKVITRHKNLLKAANDQNQMY